LTTPLARRDGKFMDVARHKFPAWRGARGHPRIFRITLFFGELNGRSISNAVSFSFSAAIL
jgi:hypothetical protein